MKTLIAFLLFTACCAAQTVADFEREKFRVRITVTELTANGGVCLAARLIRDKLGREVPGQGMGTANDPFATSSGDDVFSGKKKSAKRDPFDGPSWEKIVIVDLPTMGLIKAGDVRDLVVYPVKLHDTENKNYAMTAANALLASQGKYALPPATVQDLKKR